jgi:hypothetical protein
MRRTNLIARKEAMATERLIQATRREICWATRHERHHITKRFV